MKSVGGSRDASPTQITLPDVLLMLILCSPGGYPLIHDSCYRSIYYAYIIIAYQSASVMISCTDRPRFRCTMYLISLTTSALLRGIVTFKEDSFVRFSVTYLQRSVTNCISQCNGRILFTIYDVFALHTDREHERSGKLGRQPFDAALERHHVVRPAS